MTISNIDWLINMTSADIGSTFDAVKSNSKLMADIERYVKGEIYEYSDLIKVMTEKVKNEVKK
jgi:hypothetical protein